MNTGNLTNLFSINFLVPNFLLLCEKNGVDAWNINGVHIKYGVHIKSNMFYKIELIGKIKVKL